MGALWGQRGGPGALWALPAAAGCGELSSASHPPPPPTSPHRGTFYQGYLCTKCGVGAHKECLEVTPPCKISEYRRPPAMQARGLVLRPHLMSQPNPCRCQHSPLLL